MKINYLFLFTIGPVQSFIAQARKTQDLYSGSRLLSDLIKYTIEQAKVFVPNGVEIIFPADNVTSNPNRFIAVIQTDKPETVGQELENYIKNKFKKIADDIFEKCNGKSKPENFDNQIKSFFQIYRVALKYDKSQYKKQYKEIEQILGGVKNIRQFEQLEEQGKRKCSLCGERNALFYKWIIKENGKTKRPAYLQNDAIEIKKLDHGEGLCAVCFTKRFYEKTEISSFPSTAEIALMDILDTLKNDSLNDNLLDEFKTLVNKNGENNFNVQLYFEENLNETYFKKYDLKKYLAELPNIKDKQKKIAEKAKQQKLKLSRYYAIIAFDGDSMGKWLSGEKLSSAADLKAFHKALSEKLGEFTRSAKKYLDKPKGKTVYAGGDDFLGFITLKHLFDVMKTLREKFDKQVNQPLKKNFKLKSSEDNLSFSAGIAIAHYKTPLSIVLAKARNMEKQAKDIDDKKNAFAIAVLKHSGEIQQTVYKWKYDECESLEVIKNLTTVLVEDVFSNTFIKNLDLEFRRLMDNNGRFGDEHIMNTEIKRLVTRSCMMQREAGESKKDFKIRKQEEISELSNSLCNLFYSCSKNLENFLSSLHIADFIKREI